MILIDQIEVYHLSMLEFRLRYVTYSRDKKDTDPYNISTIEMGSPSHCKSSASFWSDNMSREEAQRAEAKLNKISNNINKTYTGLISVLQGFQKCIA